MNRNLNVFKDLNKSKFRSSFSLKQKDFEYIDSKGLDVIQSHCKDFVEKRLSNTSNFVDGKQTPVKGHPVFIAQHATATCCRGCLMKWHYIEKNRELTVQEKEYIVQVIMNWINNQIKNRDKE